MSMTITLYENQSEWNKIKKTLNNLSKIELTGTLKDATNIETPVITIETTSGVLDKNYAYIPDFGRYYFITDKQIITTNLVKLSLQVDVLMSFQNEILNTPCHIERSTEMYNKYINDNEQTAYNFPMVLTKAFSTSFDTPKLYLAVASSVETP